MRYIYEEPIKFELVRKYLTIGCLKNIRIFAICDFQKLQKYHLIDF